MRDDYPAIRVLQNKSGSIKKLALKLRAKAGIPEDVLKKARVIVEDVEKRGDKALFEYEEKLDGVKVDRTTLKVTQDEMQKAYCQVSEELLSALNLMKQRLERVQDRILDSLSSVEIEEKGCRISYKPKPLLSCGCYVPGGRAAYPSSLIMTVVPAQTAKVPRIAVCTPPSRRGISPTILAAARLCGVREFYRMGGAQAVAALAYGTESVESVDKIVGPGGLYVTAAKMIVSNKVSIDLPAGPTELLVYADDSADPRNIAFDLVSQAEHGEDSICGLISSSASLIEKVRKSLPEALKMTPRKSTAEKALTKKGIILKVKGVEEAIEFINSFAPEHLQICTSNPEEIERMVLSSGLVLLGSDTPTAISDYIAGTDHVLPTLGYGSTSSGLSVLSFVKMTGVVKCTTDWLRGKASTVKTLAEAEGLMGHSNAVTSRLRG